MRCACFLDKTATPALSRCASLLCAMKSIGFTSVLVSGGRAGFVDSGVASSWELSTPLSMRRHAATAPAARWLKDLRARSCNSGTALCHVITVEQSIRGDGAIVPAPRLVIGCTCNSVHVQLQLPAPVHAAGARHAVNNNLLLCRGTNVRGVAGVIGCYTASPAAPSS
jgi:hypothetical protein